MAKLAAEAGLPANLAANLMAKWMAKWTAGSQLPAKWIAKFAAKFLVVHYTNGHLEVVSLAPAMPPVDGPCPGPRSLARAPVSAERAEMSEMHLSTRRR